MDGVCVCVCDVHTTLGSWKFAFSKQAVGADLQLNFSSVCVLSLGAGARALVLRRARGSAPVSE